MLKNINKMTLIGVGLFFLFTDSKAVHAELKTDTDRAHCAGYADVMLSTYRNRYYRLMSDYFGATFEQDGAVSSDPKQLQDIYDAAYDSIDKTARIGENLDPLCEEDYVAYAKIYKKKQDDARKKKAESQQ